MERLIARPVPRGASRRRSVAGSLTGVLVLAALLSACETSAPAAPRPGPASGSPASTSPTSSPPETTPPSPAPAGRIRVAFIQDLSPEGALERTVPAAQGARLAFAAAAASADGPVSVEFVVFDTRGSGDRAAEIAEEIAADPDVVAALAAPDLGGQAVLAHRLAAAGVPLLSLSARNTVPDPPPGTWLRFVAPVRAQARALAAEVASLRASRTGICVVPPPPDGSVYARAVQRSLPHDPAVTVVPDAAGAVAAGCGVVVWTGDGRGGAELALGLSTGDHPAPVVVGGPGLRDAGFLELAGGAGEGSLSLCSCAEVSTSLGLAARRFTQDYQSQVGSPPGPFAVEAWDAAHLLVRAIRDGGGTRDDVRAWLAGVRVVEGLGGTYGFTAGELADPAAMVRTSRVDGGRWTPVDPARGGASRQG